MTPWWAAVCLWMLVGSPVAADDLVVPDYLGSPSPVSVRGTPSLPSDGPLAPSAGPSTVGGGGSVPGASAASTASVGATPGASSTVTTLGASGPAEPGAAAPGPALPEASKAAILALPAEQRAALLQQLQGLGGKFASILPEVEKLFESTPTGGPRDEAAFQEQRAGERAGFTAPVPFGVKPEFGQTLNEVSPSEITDFGGLFQGTPDTTTRAAGELAGGAAGEAAGALGSIGAAAGYAKSAYDELGILNSRASSDQKIFDTVGKAGQLVSTIYGGPAGNIAAGLVHQYISTPLVEAIFGKFGPSQAWKDFPINVGNTLRGTEAANQQLAVDLVNANTPEAQTAALQKFKAAVEAGGVGGFSGRAGDIPDEPGAGGSKHEGGTFADFTGEEVGLRAELDAARSGASPEARLAALRDAMGGFFAKQDMATPGPIREGALTPGQAANLSTITGTTIPAGDPTAAAAALATAIEQAKTASAATNESGYVTPPADLLAAYQQLTGTPYTAPGAEAPPPAGTPEAFEWSSRHNLAGNTGGN